MTASAHKVLIIASSIKPEGLRLLEPLAQIATLGDYATAAETAAAARDVDAILARTGKITREVIAAAPRLRIVARHGVGYDNVDVAACTERGIAVTITGDANSEAVSEHAMALILASARQLTKADRALRAGMWDREAIHGIELAGKTLGLVGIGRTGSRVARHAAGFSMRVIAHDPYAPHATAQDLGVELVDLPTLLAQADYVSVHAPLTPETRHLIGAAQLRQMKPTAILVNTSRGGLVDEAALSEALSSGRIAAAALDVFETEPLPAGHPLTRLDNVILSPHVAGTTEEALVRMAVGAAEAVRCALRGERPPFVVNPDALVHATWLRQKTSDR
ncbi:MAG: hydroxyacid dehydrogenase [Chloroflexota bacterium]